MSNNKGIWGDIVMDDGYVQIPQLLRKNRTKLGLSNTEYTVLIDYIDEWHFTKTTNPYPKLMEYSGLCESSLQKLIKSIENKGLLKREIISEPVLGNTGVKFNLSPLLNKLRTLGEEKSSTTPGVEESSPPGIKTSTPPGIKTSTPPGIKTSTPNTKIFNTKNKEKEKETTKEKEKESRLQKDFEKFWDTYPRKKSKGDAEKAWKQLKPSSELVEIIISKVVLLKSSQEWLREGGEFIPYPATWLRAKGWEDEVGPTSVAPAEPDDTESAMQEFFTLNHQRAKDEILKDYEDEEDFNRRNSPNVRTGLISQKLWRLWGENNNKRYLLGEINT